MLCLVPCLQDEMASGEAGRLYQVMAAMARPVRLTRGKQIDAAWSVKVGAGWG
jgi:glycyl-tRNA synthetase